MRATVSICVLLPMLSGVAQAQRTAAGPSAVFRLEEATIADIHAAFDAGALTCRQLVQLYLDRVAAYEDGGPRLNAITTLNPRALEMATGLDVARTSTGRRQGPLHCIPVLLKDNIDTRDMPTSNGSAILKDALPPDDAYITRALREAGALIIGKAAMGEFAGGSYNSIDGQTVNPYHFKRQTSGSSSGAAAAIAANLTVLAVGSDTSTSVRGPAAFTGVVGLRPTTGLISRDGIAPKNLTFDTAGPMARSVSDVAGLLSVIAGADPNDPLSVEVYRNAPKAFRAGMNDDGKKDYSAFLRRGALKGVRLGVVRDFFGGDPEVGALADAALGAMRELGAELTDIRLDPEFVNAYIRGARANIRRIADYRFKQDWETYLRTLGPNVPKTVGEFIELYETKVARSPLPVEATVLDLLKRSLNTSTDDPAYKALVADVLPRLTRLKLAMFDTYRVDALVFPFEGTFARPISNPVARVDDATFVGARGRPNPGTFAGYSSVGFPAIVVPIGFGSQGLPAAISFMGRPYDDGKVIGFAYDYEQATKLRRPSPLVPPLPGEEISSTSPTAARLECVPESRRGVQPSLAGSPRDLGQRPVSRDLGGRPGRTRGAP